jgi:putative tricarboxylic transport membrane protein
MAEQSLRQALIISQGDWSAFVTRPISASLLFIAVLLLVGKPLYKRIRAVF